MYMYLPAFSSRLSTCRIFTFSLTSKDDVGISANCEFFCSRDARVGAKFDIVLVLMDLYIG